MGVPRHGKFCILALKDHVSMDLSVKGLSSRGMPLFGCKGKMMRHVKSHSMGGVGERKVSKLLKLVAEKGELPDSCPRG